MFRIVLKLWPALLPLIIYFLWVLVIERFLFKKFWRKKTEINGEKIVGEGSTIEEKSKPFSLHNQRFVVILYVSLILAILLLVKLGI